MVGVVGVVAVSAPAAVSSCSAPSGAFPGAGTTASPRQATSSTRTSSPRISSSFSDKIFTQMESKPIVVASSSSPPEPDLPMKDEDYNAAKVLYGFRNPGVREMAISQVKMMR